MKVLQQTTSAEDLVKDVLPAEVTCYGCKSKLLIELSDLTIKNEKTEGYRGDSYNENMLYYQCPICRTSMRWTKEKHRVIHAIGIRSQLERNR